MFIKFFLTIISMLAFVNSIMMLIYREGIVPPSYSINIIFSFIFFGVCLNMLVDKINDNRRTK